MKYFTKIALSSIIALSLFACKKEAHLSVQNKIKDVTIANIKWGPYKIYEELEPGETSSKITIRANKKEFPKKYPIEFSMRADNKSVYLRTEKEYGLDFNQNEEIEIEDDTKTTKAIED